jgi:thiamine kinase-like enzyme
MQTSDKTLCQGVLKPQPEMDCYQLIVFNDTGTHIFLQQEHNKYSLPEVCISRFARPAQEITSFVRNIWALRTVLLWSDLIESEQEGRYYAALETTETKGILPAGLEWFPIHKAVLLIDARSAALLEACQVKAVHPCLGIDAAPFSRLGWMRRLRDWIRVTGPAGIELKDFFQLNGSGSFCLIRFETTSQPLWFKAVGQPNLHEFSIVLALSQRFPDYLPTILSFDPRVNGWLMENSGERTLRDTENVVLWKTAIQRLASLQIQSISCTSELLQAECRDLRIERLIGLVSPFFDLMVDLMARQAKSSPPALTSEELAGVASAIRAALHSMSELKIPVTLGHGDFNPGNILVDPDRCVFTDWAEAHVSHPFLTLEYLLAHLRKTCPTLITQQDHLRKAYTQYWLSTTPLANIDRALRLSPLIAVYAHAISGSAWRDPERRALPKVQAYLRSLTRRMEAEVVGAS